MNLQRTFVLLFISLLFAYAATAQYTYTNNNMATVCFKNHCHSDTLILSTLKKAKSLPLITNDEDLKILEFTIMLTDVNDQMYISKIKFDYLDRSNLDLLARSYKTMQITDIIARNKKGDMFKLKQRNYFIIP